MKNKENANSIDSLRQKLLSKPTSKTPEGKIIDEATSIKSEQYALAGHRAYIAAAEAGLPKEVAYAASATAIGTLAGFTMQKSLN